MSIARDRIRELSSFPRMVDGCRECVGWFLSNCHKPEHTWEEGISFEELPTSDWSEEMIMGYK